MKSSTPKMIRILLFMIFTISFGCALLENLFHSFGITPSPQDVFELSWYRFTQGWIWQPISSLFVQPIQLGISFDFLFILGIHLYLFWFLSPPLLQRVGKTIFLLIAFLLPALANIIVLVLTQLFASPQVIAGTSPLVVILLSVWLVLFGQGDLFLLPGFPISIRKVIQTLLGFILILSFITMDITSFLRQGICIGLGYGCALLLKKYSFSVHETQSEEEFLRGILNKISIGGMDSLSWNERRRFEEIQKKKNFHKEV